MLGFLFGRGRVPVSPELGELGTHAYRVTDWQPGPTSWRPVNPDDSTHEPLRRTRAVRGSLAMHGDKTGIPLFQGEHAPQNAGSGDGVDVNAMIDAYQASISDGGYPS